MTKIHREKDGDADIGCQEPASRPVLREEDGEPVDETQKGERYHGDPGSIRLEDAAVW